MRIALNPFSGLAILESISAGFNLFLPFRLFNTSLRIIFEIPAISLSTPGPRFVIADRIIIKRAVFTS